MKITFPRGDMYAFPFSIEVDGEKMTDALDDVWFTVKKKYTDPEALISKRLSVGTITGDGNGNYVVTIQPEDTEGLCFGSYVFDIQVQKLAAGLKRTITGTMELTPEVTWKGNEGDGEDIRPGVDPAGEDDAEGIIEAFGTDEWYGFRPDPLADYLDIAGEGEMYLIIYCERFPMDGSGNADIEWTKQEIATEAEAREIISAA